MKLFYLWIKNNFRGEMAGRASRKGRDPQRLELALSMENTHLLVGTSHFVDLIHSFLTLWSLDNLWVLFGFTFGFACGKKKCCSANIGNSTGDYLSPHGWLLCTQGSKSLVNGKITWDSDPFFVCIDIHLLTLQVWGLGPTLRWANWGISVGPFWMFCLG